MRTGVIGVMIMGFVEWCGGMSRRIDEGCQGGNLKICDMEWRG
jgi:hypothetical protein